LSRYPIVLWRYLLSLKAEYRDALIYGFSALFALLTALFAGLSDYRQWGKIAIGPYLLAALISLLAARRFTGSPNNNWTKARISAFFVALIGATLLPLALEVAWQASGLPGNHEQPEVVVVEQAAKRVAKGKDPYQLIKRRDAVSTGGGENGSTFRDNQHVASVAVSPSSVLVRSNDTARLKGSSAPLPSQVRSSSSARAPAYEAYFPYLPGMVLFGLPSSSDDIPARLSDARVAFTGFTLIVAIAVLALLCKGTTEPRIRALQALTVLPTAALPLVTGGDDLPVLAFMLLGLVLLQRRNPMLSGLALGMAGTLKFTAWPLIPLALLVAKDKEGNRAIGRMALAVSFVVVPTILPSVMHNPVAFIDNVIRFPLGLTGIHSPAASPLLGHLIATAFPGVKHLWSFGVILFGLALMAYLVFIKRPRSASDAARATGLAMAVVIIMAPATRFGYLIYPLDLLLWSWMLWEEDLVSAMSSWLHTDRAVPEPEMTNRGVSSSAL
jgi:hypothetical protein